MKKLSNIERGELILTEDDMAICVQPIDELPVPSAEQTNKAYLLTKYQSGYITTFTYKCKLIGNEYKWVEINYYEPKPTSPCSKLWATSVRNTTSGRATVRVHWEDPEDTVNTHWAYSVLVKKLGSVPSSIHDGIIVGYSSVRNQYAGKLGMIDSIDVDTVDDTTDCDDDNDDIIDNTVMDDPIVQNERYYYNVFPVSIFNIEGPGIDGGCTATLTWKKFQEIVQQGIASHALDLGDCVSVKWTYDGEHYIHVDFEVVAFDNARLVDTTKQHSVTFMAKKALFRASFDSPEVEYELSKDTSWGDKVYYDRRNGHFAPINTSDPNNTINSPAQMNTALGDSDPYSVFERNPCNNAGTFGRNSWKDSNARQWLNSISTTSNWFEPQHLHDKYDDDPTTASAYGRANGVKFIGFLAALDPDLVNVIAEVKINTTKPHWVEDKEEELEMNETIDKIFFPSYVELFGRNDEKFPVNDINKNEGSHFDIYRDERTNTRLKCVIPNFNTTLDDTYDENNLCNWYMRSPVYTKDVNMPRQIPEFPETDCIETVSCEDRRYDTTHHLGEDGGTGWSPAIPLTDNAIRRDGRRSDRGRDDRENKFSPIGTTIQRANNTAPGFVPCFVVA